MPLLIAIDDTDNPEPGCVGTGKRARRLAAEFEERGAASAATVTRHQLLVHPDIPFTSHNSAACIEVRGVGVSVDEVWEIARAHLLAHRNAGANPGLCMMDAGSVPAFGLGFAKRAQTEVLSLEEADEVSARIGARVWSDGDTGQGRIGALAAVALRASGEDGRFIGLPGIRDLEGILRVREILARTPIEAVQTLDGASLPRQAWVDTGGWVRPVLQGGRPVLRVQRREDRWVPEEKWRTWR